MNNEKIKVVDIKKGTLINPPGKEIIGEKKVSFSFEDFNGDSIKLGDYNSYYYNLESSRNAVSDFFNALKNISHLKVKHFFEPSTKKAYHLNQFDDEELVDRIENILINGYLFPKEKIEQFEKVYWEFQIFDGKRVICHKVDEILYPLFIDCNHMICKDSSRNYKAKMGYSIKSSFVKQEKKDLSKKDLEMKDNLKMIVEESIDPELTKEDIIDLLKEIDK